MGAATPPSHSSQNSLVRREQVLNLNTFQKKTEEPWNFRGTEATRRTSLSFYKLSLAKGWLKPFRTYSNSRNTVLSSTEAAVPNLAP